YLSDGSDLDLLWPLSSPDKTGVLLSDIARVAKQAPMRLDGEVTGPGGGVQWRELTGTDECEVLVKGPAGMITTMRSAFLAGHVS
ncbi:phosphoribosyl-dephospho-CoA transferase, partial [Bradyrhizobium sp. 24]|nr:phosphoribosyl-dephospho-CoA transferase [Bradyrhizobium sp. 24]